MKESESLEENIKRKGAEIQKLVKRKAGALQRERDSELAAAKERDVCIEGRDTEYYGPGCATHHEGTFISDCARIQILKKALKDIIEAEREAIEHGSLGAESAWVQQRIKEAFDDYENYNG